MKRTYRRLISLVIFVVLLDIYTIVMYFQGKFTEMIWDTWLRYMIGLNIVVVVFVIILTILNRKR